MLQIRVFMNKVAMEDSKPCMERIINWDSSLKFPVDETVCVMKALYGSQCIVVLIFF